MIFKFRTTHISCQRSLQVIKFGFTPNNWKETEAVTPEISEATMLNPKRMIFFLM
jgi:hypothetical protein